MTFDWNVSFGDIVAFCALLGSIAMFILTSIKQSKSKDSAINANSFYDAAKKYYDLMVELTPKMLNTSKGTSRDIANEVKKAICDASIVKIGSGKWILKVFNKGNMDATNVIFKYLKKDAPTILGSRGDAFPIKLLEQQKNVDYHLVIHMGLSSSSWEYEVTWTNEDGTVDRKKGVLTLPLT